MKTGYASYVQQMKAVEPTEAERAAVMASLAQARRAAAGQRERVERKAEPRVVWGALPRRAVLGAAAAVALVLVAGTAGTLAGSFGAAGAATDGPVLAAYADGTQLDDGSVLLPADFGSVINWSGGDDGAYTFNFQVDLSLAETRYRSLTYTIDGGDATFSFMQSRANVSTGDDLADYQGVSSFILSDASIEGTYSLDVTVPGKEVAAVTNDPLTDSAKVCALAAQKLAGTRITVTATDAAGTEHTLHFELNPVEDFAQRYAKVEQQQEGSGNHGESLFTMKLVD